MLTLNNEELKQVLHEQEQDAGELADLQRQKKRLEVETQKKKNELADLQITKAKNAQRQKELKTSNIAADVTVLLSLVISAASVIISIVFVLILIKKY